MRRRSTSPNQPRGTHSTLSLVVHHHWVRQAGIRDVRELLTGQSSFCALCVCVLPAFCTGMWVAGWLRPWWRRTHRATWSC